MITTRTATNDDKAFLWGLKKAAMSPYVSAVYGWDDGFQRSFFEKGFKPDVIQIIEQDGQSIGMYELQDRDDALYIDRIEIIPERQRCGVGSHLLQRIIHQAIEQRKPLRLQVFKVNPAQHLYRRLGFRDTGETDTHIHMEYAQPEHKGDHSQL